MYERTAAAAHGALFRHHHQHPVRVVPCMSRGVMRRRLARRGLPSGLAAQVRAMAAGAVLPVDLLAARHQRRIIRAQERRPAGACVQQPASPYRPHGGNAHSGHDGRPVDPHPLDPPFPNE